MSEEDWPPPATKDDAAFYNVNKSPRPNVSAVFKYGSTILVRQTNHGWVWEATDGRWHEHGFDPWRWVAIRDAKKAVRKEKRNAANANVTFNY